jgi:hypothetical protein
MITTMLSGILDGLFDITIGGFTINFFAALLIVAIIIAVLKYGKENKFIQIGIPVIAALVLTLITIPQYMEMRADMAEMSYTNGSISYVDIFEDYNVYDMELGREVQFYKEGTAYVYTKDIPKRVEDFKGDEKKYNLLVNDKPCDVTLSAGATLYGLYELKFIGMDGEDVCAMALEIRIVFSISKVSLKITSYVSEDDYGLLAQYIAVEGLNLRLIDGQYSKTQLPSVTNNNLRLAA